MNCRASPAAAAEHRPRAGTAGSRGVRDALGLHPDLRLSTFSVRTGDRLRAHARRGLDDDVTVLLAELTLPGPGLQPAAAGQPRTPIPCGRRYPADVAAAAQASIPPPGTAHLPTYDSSR